jgi:Leucine-rich repeat (LRR) protein
MLCSPLTTGLGVLLILSLAILYNAGKATAQATTDPVEVTALNTILARWGKKAPESTWNISGEPCSGWAIDDSINMDNNREFNPGIKCDCTYNSSKTCHIIKLRVYALEVVGTLPDELQNLRYLNYFDVDQNYLTGPVPAFIGNLTRLEELHIGFNALSGPIPKELGNLQNLNLLGISVNNLSGSIPDEFGNMTSLQRWYMDSSGLTGKLPETLSKLTNMELLVASDNAFTGKIPDYIGTSWTNMQELKFQGNSFQGPIPANLANLVKLTSLHIGDIINGSSSTLDFVKNMSSLSTLILRNCKISDSLPNDFSQYGSLLQLDLSFNNISGQLPQSLFSLSTLNYLFLGNNSLTGSLPSGKSSSLVNIDLSYNQLSGSFPSWVNIDKNLQL